MSVLCATVGTLIAGNDLGVATGVGQSSLDGTGYAFVNDKTRADAGSAVDNRWIQTDNDEIWDLGSGRGLQSGRGVESVFFFS